MRNYYTLNELSLAKLYIETANEMVVARTFVNDHGETITLVAEPLIDAELVAWGQSVIEWFAAFWNVCRIFHRNFLHNWHLSIKGIWQCIRRFHSPKDINYLWGKMINKVRVITKEAALTKLRRARNLINKAVALANEVDACYVPNSRDPEDRRGQAVRSGKRVLQMKRWGIVNRLQTSIA